MNFFINEIGDWIVGFVLSVVRILVILLFVPLFEFKQVKAVLIKVAISFGIGLPVYASIIEQLYNRELPSTFLSLMILKEVAIGLVIGYVVAIPFWIFRSTGALIDNQRGALSAGYHNPASGPDASMLGDLFQKLVVLAMLYAGILPELFTFIYLSHELWPALDKMPAFQNMAWYEIVSLFNLLIKQFVLYAGPVVLILLLVEAAFAILGAYSPQLQVYFMAMPAKSLMALFIVVLYLPYLLQAMEIEAGYYFDLVALFERIFQPSTDIYRSL